MENEYRNTIEGKRRFSNPKIYQASLDFQSKMKEEGVAWHNHYADECTIDFCCCMGDNMKERKGDTGIIYPATQYHTYIPSFRSHTKQIFEELFEEIKHGDKEHVDWLKNKMDEFIKKNF